MKDVDIYNKLMERGYDSYSAKLVSSELMNLNKTLFNYLEAWIENMPNEKEIIIQNYSLSRLRTERGMTYPAALLTMDWLMKEPEKALKSLECGIK